MVNTISFMTANYVARQLGYHMTGDWMQGQNAVEAWFAPADTYTARLEAYLADVAGMGFTALDLWMPLLDESWATEDRIAAAVGLLKKHNLQVVSLAGGFGSTRQQFEHICRIANAVGAPILGGGTSLLTEDRSFLVDTLKKHGLKLGIENHPEKNSAEIRTTVGDGGDGTIGACVDTGWFGTYDYDAATALEELADVLLHVHLKDVRAVGGHDTCRFGEGVVPIHDCVKTLQRVGYTGAISIEHEPHDFDPTEDVKASYAILKSWLA